jgi:hypothetical protein
VGYLLSRWLEVADLESTTRDGYDGYIRRNIVSALGPLGGLAGLASPLHA